MASTNPSALLASTRPLLGPFLLPCSAQTLLCPDFRFPKTALRLPQDCRLPRDLLRSDFRFRNYVGYSSAAELQFHRQIIALGLTECNIRRAVQSVCPQWYTSDRLSFIARGMHNQLVQDVTHQVAQHPICEVYRAVGAVYQAGQSHLRDSIFLLTLSVSFCLCFEAV